MEDKEINLLPINKRLTTPLPPFLLNIDPKIKFEIITPVDTPVWDKTKVDRVPKPVC